jgi:hypothetical protein
MITLSTPAVILFSDLLFLSQLLFILLIPRLLKKDVVLSLWSVNMGQWFVQLLNSSSWSLKIHIIKCTSKLIQVRLIILWVLHIRKLVVVLDHWNLWVHKRSRWLIETWFVYAFSNHPIWRSRTLSLLSLEDVFEELLAVLRRWLPYRLRLWLLLVIATIACPTTRTAVATSLDTWVLVDLVLALNFISKRWISFILFLFWLSGLSHALHRPKVIAVIFSINLVSKRYMSWVIDALLVHNGLPSRWNFLLLPWRLIRWSLPSSWIRSAFSQLLGSLRVIISIIFGWTDSHTHRNPLRIQTLPYIDLTNWVFILAH